ncbi:LolA family protein [Aurantibacter crassamenti]|uniref:LolA family protein n=1 Tax=Aurantibacter crassamenti TaxID=1837375 RepID=UPI001EED179A|nr:outer membrane lipoprotein carrier protein LolA [Aurantibacter crassamenti]
MNKWFINNTSIKSSLLISAFIILFATGELFAQTQMNSDEAAQLQASVKSLAETTKTITADFVQFKHLDFLSNDIESNGKLSFKSPDMLKWAYVKPFKYSVLFKNDMLYINNEGEKNNIDIGSNKLFKQLNKLISTSITGDMFNTEEFRITYFNIEKGSEVHFSPKDEKFAKYIKEFHITFNEKATVSEVKMIEPTNDYTLIQFSNRLNNQNIPDAVFAQ